MSVQRSKEERPGIELPSLLSAVVAGLIVKLVWSALHPAGHVPMAWSAPAERGSGEIAEPAREGGRTSTAAFASIQVMIDEIIPDQEIRGHVVGLPNGAAPDYIVVVYVKTDRWYRHPYPTGGAGRAFAEIQSDGSWQLATVRRAFRAERVAAAVVRRSEELPPVLSELSELKRTALVLADPTGSL